MYTILDRPGIVVVSRAILPSLGLRTLCRTFVTAKLWTLKRVEAFKIIYVTAKLQDRAMHDETLVVCITAEFWNATIWDEEL